MDENTIQSAALFEHQRRTRNKEVSPDEKLAAMSEYSKAQLAVAADNGVALTKEQTKQT